MSVVPLPLTRRRSGRASHGEARDVPGTVNIQYGHRLSQRAESRRRDTNFLKSAEESRPPRDPESMNAKQQQQQQQQQQQRRKEGARCVSILPEGPKSRGPEVSEKDARELRSIARTYAFEERTDKRILGRNVRCLVDEGMAAYEADIDARREKLRRALLAEERDLAREVVESAQRGAERRADEARRRADDVARALERDRLATVASARTQQLLTESPEARARLAARATRDAKSSNVAQMADNEAKRRAERELDELWYGLALRELEARRARDAEEVERRAAAGRKVAVTLERQIAGKLALDDEEKRAREGEEREYLAELWESVRREELANHEREKLKRATMKSDLEEQLRVTRGRLEERAREEAEVERAFRELGEAELARERETSMATTRRLRREVEAYTESLAELRREEARRDAEVETVVEAARRELQERRDDARRREREARSGALRRVLEGRERQLRAKRMAHEEATRRREVEAEAARRESEAAATAEAEAEARRRASAARYGRELLEQRERAEVARRREREDEERTRLRERERERERRERIEELVNAAGEVVAPHAFAAVLRERTAATATATACREPPEDNGPRCCR